MGRFRGNRVNLYNAMRPSYKAREYGQLKKGQGETNDRLDLLAEIGKDANSILANAMTDLVAEQRKTNALLEQLLDLDSLDEDSE